VCHKDSFGDKVLHVPANHLTYSLQRGPFNLHVKANNSYEATGQVTATLYDREQSHHNAKYEGPPLQFTEVLNSQTCLPPDGLLECVYLHALLKNQSVGAFESARQHCLKQCCSIDVTRSGLSGDAGEQLCAHILIAASWSAKHDGTVRGFLQHVSGDKEIANNLVPADDKVLADVAALLAKQHVPLLPIHSRGQTEVGNLKRTGQGEADGMEILFPLPPQYDLVVGRAQLATDDAAQRQAGDQLAAGIMAVADVLPLGFMHHRLVDGQSSFDFEVLSLRQGHEFYMLVETKNAKNKVGQELLEATLEKWRTFKPHFQKYARHIPVIVLGTTLLESETMFAVVNGVPVFTFSLRQRIGEYAMLDKQAIWYDEVSQLGDVVE